MTPRKTSKNGNGKAPKRKQGFQKGNPGRTPAFIADPDMAERLFGYLTEHKSKTIACAKAGLTWQTVAKWVERGRTEEDGPYHAFFMAFMRARTPIVDECASLAMNQDPKWFLANELRQEFTLKLEVEHSGGLKMELAGEIRDGLKKVMALPEVANRLADEVLG